MNSLNIAIKSLDCFPHLMEESVGQLLDKMTPILESRRGEIAILINKIIQKLHQKYDLNRLAKEYFKLLVNNSKGKHEIVNQLISLLQNNEIKEPEHRTIRELSL